MILLMESQSKIAERVNIEFNDHKGSTTVQSWRNIDEITQDNVDEYLNAIMRWHITGKFG